LQLDMHFYGIYALARAAGVKPDSAHTIAYASQFVDDALEGEVNVLDNQTAVYPIVTSHKPMDYKNTILRDQWKVWVPFHFLPGNLKTEGSFYGKMTCRKGTESQPAQMILKHALAHKTLANCDASHFIHAAWLHRNYVLYQLLPEMDLVAS